MRLRQRCARGLVGLMALSAVGCRGVRLPVENLYRIAYAHPAGGELVPTGVLRVLDLEAASHLRGEGLVLADGAVLVRRSDLHRWAAPLDRLITEALIQGLSRTRMFAVVKGPADGGDEDLVLDGRVLAFEQVTAGNGVLARVELEVWVERRGVQLFRRELRREQPCAAASPEAAVRALSGALAEVVDELAAAVRDAAKTPRLDASPGK